MASATHQRSGHTYNASTSLTLTPQARGTFQSSFDKFEHTVQKISKDDQREFSSTSIQDVWKAARDLEQQLAARQCIRNLRRIEPLLHGLERYSKVLEVLCNGTPYLPWIWAPIKLLLKLAADYDNAFEKLISAYGQIAEHLPRFDRLSDAYRDHPDFQRVLALVYSDVMEFHRRAYKFFKRSGWQCFFNSLWGRFDARFNCILKNLSRHADLVDREANAFLITEMMHLRQEAIEEATKNERERSAHQLAAVLAWLNLDHVPHCGQQHQEDMLDRLTNDCHSGTTEWIVAHQKTRTWMNSNRGHHTLWITGKPGSGKSTLCAKITQFLRKDRRSTILFCFYTYHVSGAHPHPSIFILSTLLSQLLRQHQTLSAYVYVDFVAVGLSPSLQNLKQILSTLIPQVKAPRILIDGIDECVQYDNLGKPRDLNLVKHVLRDILQLNLQGKDGKAPRLLVVSRDVLQVTGLLAKKPTLRLDDETDAINKAIRLFTHERLTSIRENFDGLQALDSVMISLEDRIVEKAKGMFLWVKLVLTSLEDDAYNLNDLKNAVANMPVGLNDFYTRIAARISLLNPPSLERVMRILRWMICSRRPLKSAELQDAIVFSGEQTVLSDNSKLPANVIDLCKPLIQILSDDTVLFVHSTVQEYLVNINFVTLLEAELCVSTSCLKYLGFSLNLLDTSVSDQTRTVDVGKGFYSLQHYVQEYWVDHVLAYASINGGHPTQDLLFNVHLEQLLAISEQYRTHHRIENPESPLHDSISAQSSEPRLAFLQHHGLIHKLISMVVQHRTVSKLHFKPKDNGKLRDCIVFSFLLQVDHLDMSQKDDEDPTPFSTVNSDYNKRVHALLTTDAFPGLTALQLTTFKAVYGPYAFVCRYPGCSKTSLGFSSDECRTRHEKSHAPPLLCTHSGCTYMLIFQSLNGLKRHVRENHSKLVRNIPKSIRHRSQASAAQSFTPSETLPSTIANTTEVVGPSVQPLSPIILQKAVPMTPPPTFEIRSSLVCLWCYNMFGSLSTLQDHLVKSHKYCETLEPPTLCAFCNDEGFITITEYIDHLAKYHNQHPKAINYKAHLICLKHIFGNGGSSLANFEDRVLQLQSITERIIAGSHGSTVKSKRSIFLFNRACIECFNRVRPLMGSSNSKVAFAFTKLEINYVESASLVARIEQSHKESGSMLANTSSFVSFQMTCLWCPRKFSSLSEAQDHQVENHEFDKYLDPTTLCDYCLHMYGWESPFSTLGAYVIHLEINHSGSHAEATEAIPYRAYLSCVLRFTGTWKFSDDSHRFAKIEHQVKIQSLRFQLTNSAEDDKLKIRHDIVFNEVCIETFDWLRFRLFKAIDVSSLIVSPDARPPVHVDGFLNSVLEQSANSNIAKRSTRWATELDIEKVIMEQNNPLPESA